MVSWDQLILNPKTCLRNLSLKVPSRDHLNVRIICPYTRHYRKNFIYFADKYVHLLSSVSNITVNAVKFSRFFSLVLMLESLIVNIACYYSTKPIKHYYDSSSQLVFSFSLFALVFSTFESKASVESMCCSKCHLALVDLYHVR